MVGPLPNPPPPKTTPYCGFRENKIKKKVSEKSKMQLLLLDLYIQILDMFTMICPFLSAKNQSPTPTLNFLSLLTPPQPRDFSSLPTDRRTFFPLRGAVSMLGEKIKTNYRFKESGIFHFIENPPQNPIIRQPDISILSPLRNIPPLLFAPKTPQTSPPHIEDIPHIRDQDQDQTKYI